MCPRVSEGHTPYKFLSGIELFMESLSTPLFVLPLSKLIENTTKVYVTGLSGITSGDSSIGGSLV